MSKIYLKGHAVEHDIKRGDSVNVIDTDMTGIVKRVQNGAAYVQLDKEQDVSVTRVWATLPTRLRHITT